jgi:hypothetical protein
MTYFLCTWTEIAETVPGNQQTTRHLEECAQCVYMDPGSGYSSRGSANTSSLSATCTLAIRSIGGFCSQVLVQAKARCFRLQNKPIDGRHTTLSFL